MYLSFSSLSTQRSLSLRSRLRLPDHRAPLQYASRRIIYSVNYERQWCLMSDLSSPSEILRLWRRLLPVIYVCMYVFTSIHTHFILSLFPFCFSCKQINHSKNNVWRILYTDRLPFLNVHLLPRMKLR